MILAGKKDKEISSTYQLMEYQYILSPTIDVHPLTKADHMLKVGSIEKAGNPITSK